MLRLILLLSVFSEVLCFAQVMQQQIPARPEWQQQSQEGQTVRAAPEIKPEDQCTMEGTVLHGATAEPLAKVRVVVRPADRADIRSSYAGSTDTAGRYLISNIDPGTYSVAFERSGFVASSYGARTVLTLRRSCAMKNIDGKLTPEAVITGHVVDEDSEPLRNVHVEALRRVYRNGRLTYMPHANASSNDKGEYRIFGIAPGKYYISAGYRDPKNFGPSEIRGDTDGDYAPIYHPSTPLLADAIAVQAVAGREIGGVNVRLARQKLPHVSGKVIGAPRGVGIRVFLMNRDIGPFRYDSMKNTVYARIALRSRKACGDQISSITDPADA